MKKRLFKGKRLLSLMLGSMLLLSLTACGKQSTAETKKVDDAVVQESSKEKTSVSVAVPKAPPALPVLYMMEQKSLGENVDINIDVWDEPETLLAMVQDGKHAMFAFPLTVVSKLYNKGVDVQLMNVNTWGVTYFLTSDDNFKDWSDLKGKTVYVPLQSSPPDALTQFFLNKAGLTVGKDVEIVYASTSEVASMLASGKAQYATLIEPQVTNVLQKNSKVRVALSFEDEWKKVTGTDTKIPNAGFGTTKTFAEKNSTVTAEFQKAYKEACEWVNKNPEEAGKLAEKYLGLNAAVVAKAIPNMGLEFEAAVDADSELQAFYKLLFDFDKSMIGGEIPDAAMYYKEK